MYYVIFVYFWGNTALRLYENRKIVTGLVSVLMLVYQYLIVYSWKLFTQTYIVLLQLSNLYLQLRPRTSVSRFALCEIDWASISVPYAVFIVSHQTKLH